MEIHILLSSEKKNMYNSKYEDLYLELDSRMEGCMDLYSSLQKVGETGKIMKDDLYVCGGVNNQRHSFQRKKKSAAPH